MDQGESSHAPAATSRPSTRPTSTRPGRPTASGTTTSRPASHSSQSLPSSTHAPAQPTVSTTHRPTSSSRHSTSSTAHSGSSGLPAASFHSTPPTTIIGASVGGGVAVLLVVVFFVYRSVRRKRTATPVPSRFSNWIDDRATRAHTIYDKSNVDPYASSPALMAQPSGSSVMTSPVSDAPTAFLELPVRGRTPTDSWISSSAPSVTSSSAPFITPLFTSAEPSPSSDAEFDRLPPAGPFAAALAHRSSRQSFSSHGSPDSSPAPTPPPMELGVYPASGAASIRSSRYAPSRRSTMRPVSIAASAHGQRSSLYSVSASTIRGAPHSAQNRRMEIVLPAPLDPANYVPAVPFMVTHSRTDSSRSRQSMSTFRGPSWRDHSPSPSREDSVAATRESDAISLRSHRSLSQRSLVGPSADSESRHAAHDGRLPPVPPLPASMTRSDSPKSSIRSDSPAHYPSIRGARSLVSHEDDGRRSSASTAADYSAPLGATAAPNLRAPSPLFAAAPALHQRVSLEQLAAAAVDTLFADMQRKEPQP